MKCPFSAHGSRNPRTRRSPNNPLLPDSVALVPKSPGQKAPAVVATELPAAAAAEELAVVAVVVPVWPPPSQRAPLKGDPDP
jgi:hypothetical protein